MSTAEHHASGREVWQGRAILHVDLDAFFAAVEQLDHPEWRGKPVIVGGNPNARGVVSTASYEARRFGVHSAMPSAMAHRLCPDAIWAPPRFDRYQELSRAVFEIFRSQTPFVQPLSVDEAFLDLTPGHHDPEDPRDVAALIRERIAALGLTASVGVATSKTVAKIASEVDKPDGLTVVLPGTEEAFLAPLPVEAMSGIGPRTASRLRALGVRTIGDIAALDGNVASDVFGTGGATMLQRARGVDERPVSPREAVKSVSNERTFSVDLRTPDEVRASMDALCTKVGVRLRAKALAGRTVTVKVRFSDFSTRTVRRTLSAPTSDERVFGPVAHDLLATAWSRGVGIRLLGVGLSGFETPCEQLELPVNDAEASVASSRDIRAGVEAIRKRFGPDAVRFGREIIKTKDGGDTPEKSSIDEGTGAS